MEIRTAEASRPVTLVILDGWGYAPRAEGNAIAAAGGSGAETYEGDGLISLPATSEHRPESQSFKITDHFRGSMAAPSPGLVLSLIHI